MSAGFPLILADNKRKGSIANGTTSSMSTIAHQASAERVVVSGTTPSGHSLEPTLVTSKSSKNPLPAKKSNILWCDDKDEKLTLELHPRFAGYLAHEKKSNIFSKYVTDWRSTSFKTLETYTVEAAIKFAAASRIWFDRRETKDNLTNAKFSEPLPTHEGHSGILAFYQVVQFPVPDKALLVPCHAYVSAEHRRDLLLIEADHTAVTRNFSHPVTTHLFLGDIVMVSRIARTEVDFDPTKAPSDHNECQWRVKRMTLFKRNTEEDRLVYINNSIDKVFIEGDMTPHEHRHKRNDRETFFNGSIFRPIVYEDNFGWALQQSKEEVKKLAHKILPKNNFPGTAYKLKRMDYVHKLKCGFNFLEGSQEESRPEDRLENFERFLRLDVSANSGTMLDQRFFKTKNMKILPSSKICFEIVSNCFIDTVRTWKKNIMIELYDGVTSICGVIDDVVVNDETLKLIVSLEYKLRATNEFFPDGAYVKQRSWKNHSFLKEKLLDNVPKPSNGWKIIKTILGGPHIRYEQVEEQPCFVFPGATKFTLDVDQNKYVSMLLRGASIVLGNAPVGCGKTTMIVTAAFESLKQNPNSRQLVLSQSINATVKHLELCGEIGQQMKPLRFISENDFNSLPSYSRCRFDLPELLPVVLQDALKLGNVEDHDTIMNYFAARKDEVKGNAWIKQSTFDAVLPIFFQIYKPNVIDVSPNSLDYLLKFVNPNEIDSCQIDDANKVSLIEMAKFLMRMPHAKFGLVGDVHMTSSKVKWQGVMEIGIKNKLFPQINFVVNHRTHPEITYLLSENFYDRDLKSGCTEWSTSEIMSRMDGFWPNPNCPVLLVHNTSIDEVGKNSKVNTRELGIVERIMDVIRKEHNGYQLKPSQVGVVSFYADQTERLRELFKAAKRLKVGPVECFKNDERDVIILATTTSSKCCDMESHSTSLAALSRCQQCMIIVGEMEVLEENEKWQPFISYAKLNGNVINNF